ncbi:18321_t:CDS:2 [Racocetra persica]|uniref:18321_t:CDS:1 n=1 Tax=Racocetra persica TaxID=160502 RepID=A0ACA9LBM9_9GLOM|nr:18321_t:CDS:2 [Racocetra persica]
MATLSGSSVSSKELRKQLNHERQKCFRNKNKETTSHLSIDISEDLQDLLNIKVPTVVIEPPANNTNSASATSEEYRKQLNRERQKCFRDKNKETTSHLYIDVSEELQHLLNTEVPTVVVKPPAIDTDSNSDNLSPILTTEVFIVLIESPIIGTNLELTNIQNNPKSRHGKTICHDIDRIDQTCRYCKAKFWMIEKDQNSRYAVSRFLLCYTNGKIQLPPAYNSALACISFSANVDHQFLEHGITNFWIHGQVYYLIGSLLLDKESKWKHSTKFTEYARYLQPVYPKLSDDTEWDACLLEASAIQTGHQLRQLFANILLFCQSDNHKVVLCEDILYQAHIQLQDLDDASNIPNVIEYEALIQLKNILLLSGKSLKDFPIMPIPLLLQISLIMKKH